MHRFSTTLAWLDCTTHAIVEAGDHDLCLCFEATELEPDFPSSIHGRTAHRLSADLEPIAEASDPGTVPPGSSIANRTSHQRETRRWDVADEWKRPTRVATIHRSDIASRGVDLRGGSMINASSSPNSLPTGPGHDDGSLARR